MNRAVKNNLCGLNGQETDRGTFADDVYIGHVVLSERNREVLLATDLYGQLLNLFHSFTDSTLCLGKTSHL